MDSAAVVQQYQQYIFIVVAFGFVVLSMTLAATVFVYRILKKYPHVMITGGGRESRDNSLV